MQKTIGIGDAQGAAVLDKLGYDGTPASYRRIQEAVLPAAKDGNLFAVAICRQTMFALGQDALLDSLAQSGATLSDPSTLTAWLAAIQRRADQKDLFFMNVLYTLYANGIGTEKNRAKVEPLLQEASQRGCPLAHLKQAVQIHYDQNTFKENSSLTPVQTKAMLSHYVFAAEKKNVYALLKLGVLYEQGRLVPKDIRKAFQYYMGGAQLDGGLCQFHVGDLCYRGDGVPKNREQGLLWLKKSADQGTKLAQRYLQDIEEGKR